VPSSTMLKVVLRQKLCGRRRQTVPSDDDVLNVVAVGCLGVDSCS